ncbi:hypothetical protein HPB47_000049 [Ixodes persulcatus]|uniref:Uncharacterized protein n=1 Tax=Ixodes persulcatus TaxID=34615 RepID=A0AC60PT72_IXOPE|nr:hypothetical protein HPB47_000049 [Ixodes persulcatus]
MEAALRTAAFTTNRARSTIRTDSPSVRVVLEQSTLARGVAGKPLCFVAATRPSVDPSPSFLEWTSFEAGRLLCSR